MCTKRFREWEQTLNTQASVQLPQGGNLASRLPQILKKFTALHPELKSRQSEVENSLILLVGRSNDEQELLANLERVFCTSFPASRPSNKIDGHFKVQLLHSKDHEIARTLAQYEKAMHAPEIAAQRLWRVEYAPDDPEIVAMLEILLTEQPELENHVNANRNIASALTKAMLARKGRTVRIESSYVSRWRSERNRRRKRARRTKLSSQ